MKKKKDEITIRSSAAEYLTYVASVGDQQDSIEMRLSLIHISEPTRRTPISYAVFCLKKKKINELL